MLNHETEVLENFIFIKEMHPTAFQASSPLFLVASLSLCIGHTFGRVLLCPCPLAGWSLHYFFIRWRLFHFIAVKRQILHATFWRLLSSNLSLWCKFPWFLSPETPECGILLRFLMQFTVIVTILHHDSLHTPQRVLLGHPHGLYN